MQTTQTSSQRSTFQPKDISLTLCHYCTVAYELLACRVSMNLRGKNDDFFFFFSGTLLNSGDRLKQEDESLPSTAAKGNRVEPPGSAGLTKAVEKGKGTAKDAQPCRPRSSHVTNIPPQHISSGPTWTMLSSPYTSFLETDSTIKTH